MSREDVKRLFDGLYAAIETRSNTRAAIKEDLNAEVRESQSAVAQSVVKNKKMDQNLLSPAFATLRAWHRMCWISSWQLLQIRSLGVAVNKIGKRQKRELADRR